MENKIEFIDEDHIPLNYIPGLRYHLSWARNRGMSWVLVRVVNNIAYMKTPHTNKQLTTKLDTLRHTNQRVYDKARYRLGLLTNPDKIKLI